MQNQLVVETRTAVAPGIEALYRRIPQWQEILAAVRAGEQEFRGLLSRVRLLKYGTRTSEVHAYSDIELHGFVLGIVSADRLDEIQTKSFLTYASHWIDDFFDSPYHVQDAEQLLSDRHDIRLTLRNMGEVGQVGFAMANRARHAEAIYKTLHRMLYGGLVQRAKESSLRRLLVNEYTTVALRFVNPEIAACVRGIQPEAYWTTNKSVLEIANAAEERLDFDSSEVWNLIYAPALYYQDVEDERARGELSFDQDDEPRLPEMVKMVHLGSEHLRNMRSVDRSYMQQLDFVAESFANLPQPVIDEYRRLIDALT